MILYKDKIVITYNFTDKHLPKKSKPDNIKEIESEIKQSEMTAHKNTLGAYKEADTPPKGNCMNTKFMQFLFGNFEIKLILMTTSSIYDIISKR